MDKNFTHNLFRGGERLPSVCIRYYNYVKNIDTYFVHYTKSTMCYLRIKRIGNGIRLLSLMGERGGRVRYFCTTRLRYILHITLLINNAMIREVWKRISKYISRPL